MIQEVIVTTVSAQGVVHIAPMGVRRDESTVIIAPFKPSTTLSNLIQTSVAVINYTDDVRVFAGCLTGRYDWPLVSATTVSCMRLRNSLAHEELRVDSIQEDEQRPRVLCRVQAQETHQPFAGFNRAQAAVIEAAVLVSRLGMLPASKVDAEIAYLTIAIEKTAGLHEREAWGWLMDKVALWRATNGTDQST